MKKMRWKFFCKSIVTAFLVTVVLVSISSDEVRAEPAEGEKLEINEANFPDPAFRDYLSEEYDEDGDGYIDDVEKVSQINVYNKGIYSLKGIEKFENLDTLHCADNNLTELDISKNKNLRNLDCANNNLTTLDVSNNPDLEFLFCNSCNLTELDVSSNLNLETLDCSSNHLTKLDLSNNLKLRSLYFNFDKIPEIDLSKNTKLDYMVMHFYELQKEGTLDVSGIYFPQAEEETSIEFVLDEYRCYKVGSYGGIEEVRIDYTPDKAMPKEGEVEINEANFPDPVFRDYLSEKYDKDGNGYLDPLGVTNIDIVNKGVSSLEGLEKFINLEFLTCSSNNLSSIDVSANERLITLRCERNQLTDLNVSQNLDLEILWCSKNNLGSLEIGNNTKLRSLYCGNCNLSELDISQNPDLEVLACYDNHLSSLDVTIHSNLEELQCSLNELTKLDVSQNANLTFLTCDMNDLTELDVSHNLKLNALFFDYDKIPEVDLSKNTELSLLGFCFQDLKPKGHIDVSKITFPQAVEHHTIDYVLEADGTYTVSPYGGIERVILIKEQQDGTEYAQTGMKLFWPLWLCVGGIAALVIALAVKYRNA